MAHIRKHPVTGKQQVRWRDPSGQERSKTFNRTADARVFKAQVEHEVNSGLYIDRNRGRVRFGEFAATWLDSKVDIRRSSWVRDESYLRNHVMPSFEGLPIGALTRADVQEWIRELGAKGLAPGTVRHCFRILRSIVEEAVDGKAIAESPCRRIALPRVEREEHLYLTPDEVRQLADVIDPQFRALALSAAYLGCRWGELAGLRREHLDLQQGRVRIVGSLEEVSGIVRYVANTKTATSRRMLSIPSFLVTELRKHLDASGSGETLQFVFTSREGCFLRRNNFRRRHWKPAVMRAGLDEGLRFHDLRHTCASILISLGAHPKEIQARLGHASITTTMDRYGHLFPSLGNQLDDKLDTIHLATYEYPPVSPSQLS